MTDEYNDTLPTTQTPNEDSPAAQGPSETAPSTQASNEESPIAQTPDVAEAEADEQLFHDDYVKGVAHYIKTCPTPMSITIKGDWGAGKSSLISQIESELQAKAEPGSEDNPNEWKYSAGIINIVTIDFGHQFSSDSSPDLFKGLLREVVEKISGNAVTNMEKVSEFANVASQIVGAMLVKSDENSEGNSNETSEEDAGFNFFGDAAEEEHPSNEVDINTLQDMFHKALEQASEERGKSEDSRLVVFIDGLDHINPEAAVDLMEQIKIHLSSPRCVFVFAADEKVLLDGIKKKLGEKAEEERAKMYLDKLIQVPMRIPTSAYNLNMLIKGLLKDKKELSGEFVTVVNTLLNNPTPRCIERYMNTMQLYQSIFGGPEGVEDSSLSMLFAAVILEVENSQVFDAVADCARGDEDHFAENLYAKLRILKPQDDVNWALLPALWNGGAGIGGDAQKRSSFFFWVMKLK